jgi:hypothetical protein
MKTWIAWAPLGDAQMERARAAVRRSLEEFGREWLADAEALRLDSLQPATRPARLPPGVVGCRFAGGLTASFQPGMLRALAEEALRFRGAVADPLAPESRTLDSFGRRQLAALLASVAGHLGRTPADGESAELEPFASLGTGSHVRATVELARRTLRFDLGIDGSLLVRPVQRRAREALASLGSRAAAVLDSRVAATAIVGHAQIRVADAAKLAPGDVLLVDRSVDEAFEFCLGADAVRTVEAFPCALHGRHALQLAARPR